MPTLQALYQNHLNSGALKPDAAQAKAVKALDKLLDQIVAREKSLGNSWFQRKLKSIKGLYCYGGVGRGKTYLMDLFFNTLPIDKKKRYHLHRFMREVHQLLKSHQGEKNPLEVIAKEFAQTMRVLCFDEFVVIDIADAMILGELFTQLFAQGICVVATSNFHPDQLYADGLKRDRFLPAIAVLKKHMTMLNVDSGIDYRDLYKADLEQRYLVNADAAHVNAFMTVHFEAIAGERLDLSKDELILNNRIIHTVSFFTPHPQPLSRKLRGEHGAAPIFVNGRGGQDRSPVFSKGVGEFQARSVIWCTFQSLCQTTRCQYDYLDIADQFDTVLLSGVILMDDTMENEARRFMHLVDALYDSRKVLIIAANVPIQKLYTGKRLAFEFARTMSRLMEMQDKKYGSVS